LRPFVGGGRLTGHANYPVIARSEATKQSLSYNGTNRGALLPLHGLLRSARNDRRYRRAGFTLVEVIVVLVILAILAAIAIPALTGYIDKAQWRGIVMQSKTQMTAVQTMIIDETVRNGGVTTYAAIHDRDQDTDYYFNNIFDATNGIDPGEGYVFSGLTIAGLKEYEHLTGDTQSFLDPDAPRSRRPVAYTDLNGAIKVYTYVYNRYFLEREPGNTDILSVCYIQNINSPDPVTQGYLGWFDDTYPNQTGELTNGWNVLRLNGIAKTSVKLY
jgi:prepilin-type N-terminal cleavage/methylation domain-containing protein